MKSDPDYRANQEDANQNWKEATPGYWKNYRANNPEKTKRNRILQIARNRRRRRTATAPFAVGAVIAKKDAAPQTPDLEGKFWLVPEIAKMDAFRAIIQVISNSYG